LILFDNLSTLAKDKVMGTGCTGAFEIRLGRNRGGWRQGREYGVFSRGPDGHKLAKDSSGTE
jgi:hypothetical protein